jgi:hypothetical protein
MTEESDYAGFAVFVLATPTVFGLSAWRTSPQEGTGLHGWLRLSRDSGVDIEGPKKPQLVDGRFV